VENAIEAFPFSETFIFKLSLFLTILLKLKDNKYYI